MDHKLKYRQKLSNGKSKKVPKILDWDFTSKIYFMSWQLKQYFLAKSWFSASKRQWRNMKLTRLIPSSKLKWTKNDPQSINNIKNIGQLKPSVSFKKVLAFLLILFPFFLKKKKKQPWLLTYGMEIILLYKRTSTLKTSESNDFSTRTHVPNLQHSGEGGHQWKNIWHLSTEANGEKEGQKSWQQHSHPRENETG